MPSTPNDYDLLPELRRRRPRIARKVGPPDPETGCQEWTGGRTLNGYGTITISAGDGSWRSVRAHRAVFMLHNRRRIAEGMTLHHTCHNPPCVNPNHLVEMTQAENNGADATGGASIRPRVTSRGVTRWAVLFREDGKQRSRTFGTLEAAESYAASRTARSAA